MRILAFAIVLAAAPATAHEVTLEECQKRCEIAYAAQMAKQEPQVGQRRPRIDGLEGIAIYIAVAVSGRTGCKALCDYDAEKAGKKE